jgi:hypothetical protein
MILRLHFWFNLLATGYWIAWTVHFSSPHSAQNPGYLWMEVLPLFVTVPVFLFSGVHLFRRTKSS